VVPADEFELAPEVFLILRPNLQVAEDTLSLSEIYGGEIVIPGVKTQISP
jgi:hypothetical protein